MAKKKDLTPDFHADCPHCKLGKPMWPLEDEEGWRIDVCHDAAIGEEFDLRIAEAQRDRTKAVDAVEKRKKQASDLRQQQLVQFGEQRRQNLLQINGGIKTMARKAQTQTQEAAVETQETAPVTQIEKPLKKTALLDSLIRACPNPYADGAKDAIVSQVLAQIEGLDAKRIAGLFFSRRSVLKKAANAVPVAA